MSKLEDDYEILGRVLAHLVQEGLGTAEIGSDNIPDVLGYAPEDTEAVSAALRDVAVWMRDEGLIRVETVDEAMGGSFWFSGVQLTSRGIAILQQKTDDAELGKTLEKTLTAPTKDGDLSASVYVKIGSFVGGALGGFTKAIS